MNQIEALRRLRVLGAPVVETRDVAALLQISTSNATTIIFMMMPVDSRCALNHAAIAS